MSIIRHEPGKRLSGVVEAPGLAFVAGQVADALAQGLAGETEPVRSKIDALLAKAGGNKSKIVFRQRVGHRHPQPRSDERGPDRVARPAAPARAGRDGRSEARRCAAAGQDRLRRSEVT